MIKEIILDDGNRIRVSIEDGYCTNMVSITKWYFKGGKIDKSISFYIWDDMQFQACLFNADLNKVEFEFDINDPIYFCLNRLLDNNKELVLEDDLTTEHMRKYMKVIRFDDKINVIFNDFVKSGLKQNDFRIFVKNIGPDVRSKISDYEEKARLVDFFRDCERELVNFDDALSEKNKGIKVKNFHK